MQVRVLGETYTPEDEEDSAVAEVTAVWVYQARYRVSLPRATAGAPPGCPIYCQVEEKSLKGGCCYY